MVCDPYIETSLSGIKLCCYCCTCILVLVKRKVIFLKKNAGEKKGKDGKDSGRDCCPESQGNRAE